MNLADSLKFVFQNELQGILLNFIKNDVLEIINEAKKDISLKNLSFAEIQEAVLDVAYLVKEIPGRLPKALSELQENYFSELETYSDSKQKSIFALKVIGAFVFILINFTGPKSMSLGLLKIQNKGKLARGAILIVIITVLTHLFRKIINAVEKNLDDQNEKDKLSYIKAALAHPDQGADRLESPVITEKSFVIVRNFINFMLTGENDE